MQYFIPLIILCSYVHAVTAQEPMSVEQIMASNEVFKNTDKKPSFPGCHNQEDSIYNINFCAYDLMHDFIYGNLKYPASALENGTEESVSLSIIVEKNGNISECKRIDVTNQTPELTEEAIRIVRSMPNWEPGKVKGIEVRSTANINIHFEIKDGAMHRPRKIDLKKMYSKVWELAAKHELDKSQTPTSTKGKTPAQGAIKSTAAFTAPMFSGCKNKTDYEQKKKCADARLSAFIEKNRKYPVLAKANNVAGMVTVKFSIEKDGSLTGIEVVNDIGSGCGEEALRLVKMMPKWEPSTQHGKPTKISFYLPINFCLN